MPMSSTTVRRRRCSRVPGLPADRDSLVGDPVPLRAAQRALTATPLNPTQEELAAKMRAAWVKFAAGKAPWPQFGPREQVMSFE